MNHVMGPPGSTSVTRLQRRRQFGIWRILLVIGVCVLAIVLLLHYRYHLYWCVAGLQDVRAIPTSPMPDSQPPKTWSRCRFGPLEFALPHEFAINVNARKAKSGNVLLISSDKSRSLAITIPTDPSDPSAISACLQGDFGLPPEGHTLTLTRLRLASYRASSQDFRWSMAPNEVRWHTWCIGMRYLFGLGSGTRAEYLLRDDLEAILNVGCPGTPVSFDWQTSDDRFGGSLVFTDSSGQSDLTWIRTICQSVRFAEDRLPQPMPQEENELRALFQVLGVIGNAGDDNDSRHRRP